MRKIFRSLKQWLGYGPKPKPVSSDTDTPSLSSLPSESRSSSRDIRWVNPRTVTARDLIEARYRRSTGILVGPTRKPPKKPSSKTPPYGHYVSTPPPTVSYTQDTYGVFGTTIFSSDNADTSNSSNDGGSDGFGGGESGGGGATGNF